MKIINVFLVSILALTAEGMFAQDQPYVLTMQQAIDHAVQHNKSLLNARDQVSISKEKFKEARAVGLPQIDGSFDFTTYFNYEMNFSFGGSGEGNTTLPDFTVSPYDPGDEKFYNEILVPMLMGSGDPIIMDNQMSGKAQISQLIFSGQYWTGLQTARIAKRLADQSLIMSEQDVKENVINSYFLTLVTEENLRIIGENIRNLNNMLIHTTNMYKAGVFEETDVDQIRITVSQLTNAQKSIERSIQLNYNMIRFQLGVAPDASVKLADNLDQVMQRINPQSALDLGFDVTGNINYQIMESQSLIGQKQVDAQNWAYAPTIAGFYSYTKKIITTGFDLTPNHLAGVSMSVPIFSSGMRHARVSQAIINLDIALRNQEMVKEQLETQRNQFLFNYQSAYENYTTQKESVDVANRVLKSIENKYREGLVSSLDLTQANNNYLSAQQNYLTALLTLMQAQTALDKLYNKI